MKVGARRPTVSYPNARDIRLTILPRNRIDTTKLLLTLEGLKKQGKERSPTRQIDLLPTKEEVDDRPRPSSAQGGQRYPRKCHV